MLPVGLKPMIAVFEWLKTLCTLHYQKTPVNDTNMDLCHITPVQNLEGLAPYSGKTLGEN
jgi:hypothetical protein